MKISCKSLLFCMCVFLSACSKHIPSKFEVVSMQLGNSNSTGEKPFDATVDSIPKQAYALKMTLQEEMRQEMAGDPQSNGFINEDQLIAISIFSLNNFDSLHPAGSSLNSYFLTQLNAASTIEAFLAKAQLGGGKYLEGNYTDTWSTDHYFYLMTPPANPGKYNFVLALELSDGRKMSDTVNVKLY